MLNLVRMELKGFKSFADKVTIPFKEGVTAIIGPNGCGKSNVADAIRWTLGEKSARQLRGKVMADVIFAGTETRRSQSFCEVSLVFDNADGHVFSQLPSGEVIITRRMDRSGGSEYLINNEPCLLRDIQGLLHDTGLGKEGYSIIGQGKVAEIMSAKPEDRRKIFEEAAGIAKFRAQRVEAEKKLESTAANLQVVNEVIGEIEGRIKPLKKQAEAAEKFFALKEQLKNQEVNLYIYNYDNIQSVKQKLFARIAETKKTSADKEEEHRQCILRYNECTRATAELDSLYEQYNAELLELRLADEHMKGEAGIIRERMSHIETEISRLSEEAVSVEAQIQVAKQLMEKSALERDRLQEDLTATERSLKEEEKKLLAISSTLDGEQSDLERSTSDYVRAIQELGDAKANYSNYVTERGIQAERAKNLLAALNGKKAKLEETNTDIAVLEGEQRRIAESVKELGERYNEALYERLEAQQAIEAYASDINVLNTRLAGLNGNLEFLVAMKNDYSGYQEAVKNLMRDARHDPVLASKLMGVLAEVIRVPSEYEAAIESALGGAMQNVLVENDRDALDIVNYLKQKNYGRATIRPLNYCRPRTLEPENRAVLREPGCLGVASDLISYDKKFDGFVQTLLGTTVVVNNAENGNYLFKKYKQAFRVVTLEGDIFARTGEITGGSRRNQTQGLLSQEEKIQNVQNSIEKTKKNIATMRADSEKKKEEIEALSTTIEQLSANMTDLKIQAGLCEDKLRIARQTAEELQAEIASGAEEYERLRASLADLEQKLAAVDAFEKMAAEKKEEYMAMYNASRSQNSEKKTEKDELGERVMQLRLKMATIAGQVDAANNDYSRFRGQCAELEEELAELKSGIERKRAELESIVNASANAVSSPEDAKRIKELEENIAGLKEKKRALQDEIFALEEKRTRINEDIHKLEEKRIRDEAMLENVDIEMRTMQEHILDDYNLTYTDALEFKDPEFDPDAAKKTIADLKRSITLLGDVNTLALKDLKETEERLAAQTEQRDDIQRAYDDIKAIIAEIVGKMQEKFSAAFVQISENFKTVFAQLFGGGKGELRLNTTESEDVLEQGIDIYAQPPGKRLQHISLLSGGEQALTAISILFAILRLKPMPFCVLDEIEAALDDANVNLFAEFLKRFSDYTQFIVITHRKPTMRHADTIFGVTMEEKGVTKIVSIEFEEAVKHAN